MFGKELIKKNKGFTLIELVIGLPLIAVIFAIGFNLFFLINNSHRTVYDSFDVLEDIRIFRLNIQREVNQAKKAKKGSMEPGKEDKETAVLVKKSNSELHVYTYLDIEESPVQIVYKLEGENLYRYVYLVKNTSTSFPYEFQTNHAEKKLVLSNIFNSDIFGDVKRLRKLPSGDEWEVGQESQEGADYRKKIRMTVKVKKQNGQIIEIQDYLTTKSRAAAD